MTGSTSEFLTWFSSWGNVIFVAAQMLFWAAVGFAAVYGALAYKRLVDHKTGSSVREKVVAPTTIKIDEFVE
ncbi:MAG: hypothetical protein CVT66_07285 [Actinobacteria bacterium HGW-Actinobacteria-6]|jgi:hypothetical protein|nr:MAG: hypothetical protein CVT66_07285 [Actinobacteria bacterium HGW-Actinobacteria-6]